MDPAIFPPINAALNGLATVFLILALILIKRGDRKGHARSMIAALAVSTVFLACYVTHKVLLGHANTRFPGQFPVARVVYLAILFTHIPLAIGMLPLIFIAVRRAVRGDFAGHRRIVKWAYPIWLYVSVTGVLVYFMLYQWFLPAGPPPGPTIPPAASAGPSDAGGQLIFEPEIFSREAAEGEQTVTATFVAKNTGPAPVTLTKLDSSCSCLKVESDRDTIPPGGQAVITAVFDIAKLSGEAEKSVFVTTDIPGAREIRLPVQVKVPAILALEPAMVTWPLQAPAAPREAVFRVLRDKPIRVLEAVSSRENVTAELRTVTEGREYRIVLTPKSTESVMLGLVKLKTDCELENFQQQLLYFSIQAPETVKEG